MVLKFDPEMATELKAHPEYTAPPPPPPEGVSIGAHLRARANAFLVPFAQSFVPHLPRDSEYAAKDYPVPVEAPPWNQTRTGNVAVASVPVRWIMGDLNMDDNHLRTLCVKLQLAIVSVDYRLVPEHLFPTAHEDCYAALKWVAIHAPELRVSLAKGFLVGGDFAGGNLAAATALRARDDLFFAAEDRHALTGQYLREPVVLHPEAMPVAYRTELRSYEENADAPLLDSKALYQCFAGYNGPPTDVRISPVLAGTHAGLPPAYLQIMECDPLRDEGVLYERLLREAGCATRLVRNPGCAHGTHYWFPGIAATVKILSDEEDGLKWLLSLTKAG